jgi:hypothetical protein
MSASLSSSTTSSSSTSSSTTSSSNEESAAFNKYLSEYYKLKSKYDEVNKKARSKIVNNAGLDMKEKRKEIQKLVPQCILCKQPGGTTFSNKFDKTTNTRILSARCGNLATPCNLNIKLNTGKFGLYPDGITEIEKLNNDLKNMIIDDKNKLLFGYVTTEDVLNNFETIKSYITTNTVELEIYIREYYNIIDNVNDKKRLKEITESYFSKIKNIKTCIESFNEEDNQQFVFDAVEIYVKELVPLLKEIMNLKYKNNMVWFDQDTNVYHLIQEKYSIKEMEIDTFGTEVINFDTTLEIKGRKDEEMDRNDNWD